MKEELQAQIIEYQKLLISEQIKQEEFDELVEDLLDLDKLDAKLKNEKLKIQAKELVELVKTACKLI